jgi:hypothetical protein
MQMLPDNAVQVACLPSNTGSFLHEWEGSHQGELTRVYTEIFRDIANPCAGVGAIHGVHCTNFKQTTVGSVWGK